MLIPIFDTDTHFAGLPLELEVPDTLDFELVHDGFAASYNTIAGKSCYAINSASDGEHQGLVAFKYSQDGQAEMYTEIGHKYRRQGIATAASKIVCQELFTNQGVREIKAEVCITWSAHRFAKNLGAHRLNSAWAWPSENWVLTPEDLHA